jgi:hypothetical protein
MKTVLQKISKSKWSYSNLPLFVYMRGLKPNLNLLSSSAEISNCSQEKFPIQ